MVRRLSVGILDSIKKALLMKLGTIYLRYLLGFAFIFASPVKIIGQPFTQLPLDNPVGYFFDSLHRTGVYWQFLGVSQYLAGVLLLTQRFATLGAIAFAAIITNIFIITISIDFGWGTPIITGLMLCGTLWLLLLDYPKLSMLWRRNGTITIDKDEMMDDPVWVITGLLFVLLTGILQLSGWYNFITWWAALMLITGVAGGAIGLTRELRRRGKEKA